MAQTHEASQKETIVSTSAEKINDTDSSCKSWDARHRLNESIIKVITSSQQNCKLAGEPNTGQETAFRLLMENIQLKETFPMHIGSHF